MLQCVVLPCAMSEHFSACFAKFPLMQESMFVKEALTAVRNRDDSAAESDDEHGDGAGAGAGAAGGGAAGAGAAGAAAADLAADSGADDDGVEERKGHDLPVDTDVGAAPRVSGARKLAGLLGSSANVQKFVKELVESKPTNLFFRVCMSDGISPEIWRSKIREIAAAARDIASRGSLDKPFRVCAFVDEANTCVNTCMTSEVLTSNTLDGEPLPDNIFWVGAINPLSKGDLVTDAMTAANQFTGVEDAMDSQVRVHRM